MEQVVVTVEALRCHQCRRLMDPKEQYFQHQVITSVSVNRHTGTTNTYALADVCFTCHTAMTTLEVEAQQRGWWRKVWTWAFVGNLVLTAFLPVGLFPLYAAIAVRVWWKWREKRRQQSAPGQADQRGVPQSAVSNDVASGLTKSGSS